LLFEFLLKDLLLLGFVNGFNKNGLVFELVTLRGKIELMINSRADLLGLSIFSEKSSEDSLSSHPEDLEKKLEEQREARRVKAAEKKAKRNHRKAVTMGIVEDVPKASKD
jgi:hypothetical protein